MTIWPRKHKRKTSSQAFTRSKQIYRIGRSFKSCGTVHWILMALVSSSCLLQFWLWKALKTSIRKCCTIIIIVFYFRTKSTDEQDRLTAKNWSAATVAVQWSETARNYTRTARQWQIYAGTVRAVIFLLIFHILVSRQFFCENWF